jgi:environmental stress-induced protein Ves
MQIIRQAAFTARPWRNGGGITHEALRVPVNGDPFRWRVSVARIEKSGPFSDFAAYRRIMVLLQGNGVVLRFADRAEHPLRRVGDVAEFDGGLATHCELANGPCVDLNLMVAKSLHGAQGGVQRLQDALALPVARGCSTLIFPIDGRLVLEEQGRDAISLEPWDLAVAAHSAGSAAIASPGATSAAVLVFLATLPDR